MTADIPIERSVQHSQTSSRGSLLSIVVGAAAGAGSVVTFAYAPSSTFPLCAAGAYGLGVALGLGDAFLGRFFDRKGNSLASGLLTAALLAIGCGIGKERSTIRDLVEVSPAEIQVIQRNGTTRNYQKDASGNYHLLEARLSK